eukprot:6213201-Pleurochrysis_carterae.AAC.1
MSQPAGMLSSCVSPAHHPRGGGLDDPHVSDRYRVEAADSIHLEAHERDSSSCASGPRAYLQGSFGATTTNPARISISSFRHCFVILLAVGEGDLGGVVHWLGCVLSYRGVRAAYVVGAGQPGTAQIMYFSANALAVGPALRAASARRSVFASCATLRLSYIRNNTYVRMA